MATVALSVAYVTQMASVTQQGYELREAEERVAVLQDAQERVHVQIAEASSVASLSERMQMLGLVSASLQYVTDDRTVARGR